MRIAVPTNDGTSISEHFGRSAAFLIFETENGKIKSRSQRATWQAYRTPGVNAKTLQPMSIRMIMPEFLPPWKAAKRSSVQEWVTARRRPLKVAACRSFLLRPARQRKRSQHIWAGSCPQRKLAFADAGTSSKETLPKRVSLDCR